MPPIFLKLYQHALVRNDQLSFLYISLINPFPANFIFRAQDSLKTTVKLVDLYPGFNTIIVPCHYLLKNHFMVNFSHKIL